MVEEHMMIAENVFLTNVTTQAQFFPQKISFVSLAPPFFLLLGVVARMPKLARKEKQTNKQSINQSNKPCGKTAEL
jgi:hypothetical protein